MANENDFGDDYVVITDEDGQEYELELLDSLEVDGREYRAFLPVSDDDEEPYEMILFRIVEEDGEETRPCSAWPAPAQATTISPWTTMPPRAWWSSTPPAPMPTP